MKWFVKIITILMVVLAVGIISCGDTGNDDDDDNGGGKKPAAPSNLTAIAVASSQINLAWTDNSGNEDGFKIERDTGRAYVQIVTVGPDVTSYQDTGLDPETEYYYHVFAYNSKGSSKYSNEASDITLSPKVYLYVDGVLTEEVEVPLGTFPTGKELIIEGRGVSADSGAVDNVVAIINGISVFEDYFSGDLSAYTVWGSPLPFINAGVGDPAPSLFTNGDGNCDSGVYTNQTFDWSENNWSIEADFLNSSAANFNSSMIGVGGTFQNDTCGDFIPYPPTVVVAWGGGLVELYIPGIGNYQSAGPILGSWHHFKIEYK